VSVDAIIEEPRDTQARYRGLVRVYDMIVDERRQIVDVLASLTDDQLRAPSLCAGWSIHDVAAHLASCIRFAHLKIYLGVFTTAGDFDRIHTTLTRRYGRRPSEKIVDSLRCNMASRITMPRSGYDPVLVDLVVHDLDIRIPMGISRTPDEERLWMAFHHLTESPAPAFATGSQLHGLRIEATDTGWAHGTGAPLRGPAESVVLAISGREIGFAQLDGDGVAILRQRMATKVKPPALQRLQVPLKLLVKPVPKHRRSRAAQAIPIRRAPSLPDPRP
jgi:uncharacterized protein (TIGR03083 family)